MKRNRGRKGGKINWKSAGVGAGIAIAGAFGFVMWMKRSFLFAGNPIYIRSDATGTIKFWSEDASGKVVMTESPIVRETGSIAGRQLSVTAGKTKEIDGVDAVAIFNADRASGMSWVERSKVTLSKPSA